MKAKIKLELHPTPEMHLAQQAQRDLHRQIYFRKDREARNGND